MSGHYSGPHGDQAWRAEGACKGMDAKIFYPVDDAELAYAKSICKGCPVKRECLEYALVNRERDGVWGGLGERERRRLIRQRLQSV